MNLHLRKAQHSDLPFLRQMLYEAVFWRDSADKPSIEEGLAYPEVHKALAGWGKREGDTAVVAIMNSVLVGAAWYRFWSESDLARGYLDENTPEVVIAVHRDHQHQGVGTRLMAWLIDLASSHSIQRLSLSVSKDNHAIILYRQQGFVEHIDKGDWFIMVRDLQT